MQLDDFDLGGGRREYGLHPQLPVISAVLLGRKDLAKDVLCVVLLIFLLGLGILRGFGRAADQDWSGVFDQRALLSQHRPFFLLQLRYYIDFTGLSTAAHAGQTERERCFPKYSQCFHLKMWELLLPYSKFSIFVGSRFKQLVLLFRLLLAENTQNPLFFHFPPSQVQRCEPQAIILLVQCLKACQIYLLLQIKQSIIINKSKISASSDMFNLCKTVKIYQTINHYHIHDSSPSQIVDSHELKYQESLAPSQGSQEQQIRIQTVESHSIAPRRQGISVSIRESGENYASPTKKMLMAKSKKDLLRASRTNSSQAQSLKLRTTQREQCESPKIIESKISWGEMSPHMKAYEQQISTKQTLPEPQLAQLPQIPLKKEITRTTHASIAQESHRGSHPKIDVEFSPLKRSSSFLRNGSKGKLQDSMRHSIELSLKNTIDLKLSTSKIRKDDASDSLLKLSCSSYSQILGQQPHYNYEEFSQTCSLELKKEQSFLKEYANDVSQSIILGKIIPEKEMKNVRSNYDLLNKDSRISQHEFKPTQSNIIERDRESPVRRLKKKYGDNLLNIYDKQTIVSKSLTSKSAASKSNCNQKIHIIDESIIINHQIQDKFKPLNGKLINRDSFRMFQAKEEGTNILVSIKEIPIDTIERINQELSVYREIQDHGIQTNISKVFQVYTHNSIYVIVKEPYQYTFQDFLQKYYNDFIIVSWEFIIQNIQESLKKTIKNLSSRGVYLSRFISSQDIVHILGEWKLHSPDMFTVCQSEETSIPAEQAMHYLKQQILGRITDRKNLQK